MSDWQRQISGLVESKLRRNKAPWHTWNDLLAEAETFQLCQEGKIDVVHFLDGEHSGPYLPKLAQEGRIDARCVASFHQPPDLASEVIDGPSLRFLDAAVLMAPSQVEFFEQYMPADRIHVILHGVDTSKFVPAKGRRRSGPLRCITTGLHLRDWNAFYEVASALPDVCFKVVTSARLNLEDTENVEIVSGISDADLAVAYQSADVLYLPVTAATANNSLLEGMASGLVVVSTDTEAIRAYVPPTAGMLIADNDVPLTVNALLQLAKDKVLRAKMARAARERALELEWSSVVRDYEALYSKVLRTPRAPMELVMKPVGAQNLPIGQGLQPWPADTPKTGQTNFSFASVTGWVAGLRDQGLTHEADLLGSALVRAMPQNSDSYEVRALAAEALWNWREAVEQWTGFLRRCPESRRSEGVTRKALALARGGDLTAARRSLEAGGKNLQSRLCAAAIETAFGSEQAARSLWQNCTFQFPDQIDGFLGLARLHLQQSRFDEAEALIDHIRKVWPESTQADLLWARSSDDRRDRQSAMARWRGVLAVHAGKADIILSYARHCGLWGLDQRLNEFLKTQDIGPQILIEARLRFHLSRGDIGAACEQAQMALIGSPRSLDFRLRLAWLLIRRGTAGAWSQAADLLQALQSYAPDEAHLFVPLALTLTATGREKEAEKLLATLSPDRLDAGAQWLRLWKMFLETENLEGLAIWRTLTFEFGLGPEDELLSQIFA